MSSELVQLLKRRFLIANLIWVGMFLSIFVYTGLAYKLSLDLVDLPTLSLRECFETPLAQLVSFASISMLGLHFFLPSFFWKSQTKSIPDSKDILASMRDQRTTDGQKFWSEGDLLLAASLSEDELFCLWQFPKWLIGFIFKLFMADLIAISGLILSFQTNQFTCIFLFSGTALVLFLMSFPRASVYFEQCNDLKRTFNS